MTDGAAGGATGGFLESDQTYVFGFENWVFPQNFMLVVINEISFEPQISNLFFPARSAYYLSIVCSC